jgi:hypothetical protein
MSSVRVRLPYQAPWKGSCHWRLLDTSHREPSICVCALAQVFWSSHICMRCSENEDAPSLDFRETKKASLEGRPDLNCGY